MGATRKEHDFLGELEIPSNVYYGIQTSRAVENFKISGLTIAMMPFAYSISDGIGFGFISYTLIKLVRGKAKEVPVFLYVLSALFAAQYRHPQPD